MIDNFYAQGQLDNNVIIPTLLELQKLVANDPAAEDQFGYSVSISDGIAVIGVRSYDSLFASNIGAAFVFERNSTSGNWTQTAKVVVGNGQQNDYFGGTVSLYNSTLLLIGADNYDGASGAAYIFERNDDGTWMRYIDKDGIAVTLRGSNPTEGNYFGHSVSLYNNTALIGEYGSKGVNRITGDLISRSGAAYIFEYVYDSTHEIYVWKRPISPPPNSGSIVLLSSDAAKGDQFGRSVSLYNNTALIGAPFYDGVDGDNNTLTNSGSAYIFERNEDGFWPSVRSQSRSIVYETTSLVANDGAANDRFGRSVSLYNNTALIGAPFHNGVDDEDNTIYGSGTAYIFERNDNGRWEQKQKLLASNGATNDFFGRSVSLYNNTALISAPHQDGNGAAYIFERNDDGRWEQTIQIVTSDVEDEDWSRPIVSVYDNTALIGLYQDDGVDGNNNTLTNSGSAYIFPTADTTAPVITLNGNPLISLEIAIQDYVELGAIVSDNDITYSETVMPNTDEVDFDAVGSYPVTYDAPADASENTPITVTRTVNVVDTTAPVITLENYGPVTLELGDTYMETVATVTDNDPNYSETVMPNTDEVDFDAVGSYPVTYDAPADASENTPITVTRTVNVVDTTAPVITLENYGPVTLELGDTYMETVATVTDNDPNYSETVMVNTEKVDFNAVGIYTVTYDAQADASENTPITVTRTVIVTTPSSKQLEKLVADDGAASDEFGSSVSISGGIAVIGVYQDDDIDADDASIADSGSAYVFERNADGRWQDTNTAKLLASDGTEYDFFGYSVSVSDGIAVIGAYQDDDKGLDSGSAYVFERNENGNWSQTTKLVASDGSEGDYFGYSVSVYNNTALIGAYGDDDDGSNSGSVYVFEYSSGTWTQTEPAKLTASDAAADDYFGYSVSVYNNTALIGAYGDDDDGSNSGSAYVFEYSSGTWTQTEPAKLTASDAAADDYFGYSVSVYNNTALIGAYGDDDDGSNSGSAYVFEYSRGTWTQTEPAKLTASDAAADDYFGYSVSISDGIAVIGVRQDDGVDDEGNPLTNSGSAYVFERNENGRWPDSETVRLFASDGSNGDQFGHSVSVSDRVAVIGAYQDDSADTNGASITDSGSAYVYSNRAPVAQATVSPDKVKEDGLITLDGTGSYNPDDKNTNLLYIWTKTEGRADIDPFSTTDTMLTFNAPQIDFDTEEYTFSLVVTNTRGVSSTNIAEDTVTVLKNQSPTASISGPSSANEGTKVDLGSTSTDTDGTISAYLWRANSTDITFNRTDTQAVSFTAPNVTAKTAYDIILEVTDNNGATSTVSYKIIINDTSPPIYVVMLDSTASLPALDIHGKVNFTASRDDPQSVPQPSLPPNVTVIDVLDISPVPGTKDCPCEFTFVFANPYSGVLLADLVVYHFEDGQWSKVTTNISGNTITFTVGSLSLFVIGTIDDQTVSPIVSISGPTSVNEGDYVELGSTSSDPDGEISAYLWSADPGITFNSTDTQAVSFTAPNVTAKTAYDIILEVTDNNGGTATVSHTINIANVNESINLRRLCRAWKHLF